MSALFPIAMASVAVAVCLIFFVAKRIKELNSRLQNENDAVPPEQPKNETANFECVYDDSVRALGDALDCKEAAVAEGHSSRVTAYTIAIAKRMGLPKEQILTVSRGAYLHDLGKIKIPDQRSEGGNSEMRWNAI